jgi:CheY-like chemotaxis protein
MARSVWKWKSAQSTKEISELISSIQREARKAVENMEKSTGIVDEGLTMGNDLNVALKKISSVVTEVYKFAQEIGAATNEQSHGSSQIARATARLNEITCEINSAVEEQASGAQGVVKAMEGIEAAERIVRHDPDARIVMVSSVGYQENIVAALQKGAKHFVQKPVKPELLYDVIKYVMGSDAVSATPAGAAS